MNALLFSDDIISQRYKNKGSLNPITTYSLSIISNILGYIISVIAVKLTSFPSLLELFATERVKEKEYVQKLNLILKAIKIKLIMFFLYEIGMVLIYLYFLSIFCSVYKASQMNWFTHEITSNFLSFAFTLGICILISIFRFLGLYCSSEHIYNISLF